jgi:hypothetical protein
MCGNRCHWLRLSSTFRSGVAPNVLLPPQLWARQEASPHPEICVHNSVNMGNSIRASVGMGMIAGTDTS